MSVDPLVERVQQFAQSNGLLPVPGPVVLAVSGGLDSVALALVWRQLLEAGCAGGEPVVAHLHHGLRGEEADAELAFVEALAERLGWPLVSDRLTSPPAHEAGLRQLRYTFLRQVARHRNAAVVAVAHQADDQAETVFLRLCRGTGLRGLAGMRPRRELSPTVTLIRPLLATRRHELGAFLERQQQGYRADSSNHDERYARNRVRQKWLPALAADLNPKLTDALLRLAHIADQSTPPDANHQERALSQAELGPPEFVRFDQQRLQDVPPAERVHLFRQALQLIGVPDGRVDFKTLAALDALVTTAAGVHTLPGGHQASVGDGGLTLRRCRHLVPVPVTVEQIPCEPVVWGDYCFQFRRLSADREHQSLATGWSEDFDWTSLRMPLQIRPRQAGDRLRPFGMPGRQKVHDLLIDAKVPAPVRDQVPIVCDQEGLLWVVPIRRAERGRIEAQTRSVLRICCERV